MKLPSTTWKEKVAPDEETRFAAYGEKFLAMQREISAKQGAGRALHRKQILALKGSVTVPDQVAESAHFGFFARPGTYPAWVRLSNGGAAKGPDSRPDVRGFAIKIHGVSGAGALGMGDTSSQDFLFINAPAFAQPTVDEFVGLALSGSRGVGALLSYLVKRYGFVRGLSEAARLNKGLSRPFSGFATQPLFSATPISVGPYAAKLRLLPTRQDGLPGASSDWAEDLRRHLQKGELRWDIQLQFYVDEFITPLEDASAEWPESETPFVTVAHLSCPTSQPRGEESATFEAEVEAHKFDPWCALAEHRPLGEVMRARKVIYFLSQKERGAL